MSLIYTERLFQVLSQQWPRREQDGPGGWPLLRAGSYWPGGSPGTPSTALAGPSSTPSLGLPPCWVRWASQASQAIKGLPGSRDKGVDLPARPAYQRFSRVGNFCGLVIPRLGMLSACHRPPRPQPETRVMQPLTTRRPGAAAAGGSPGRPPSPALLGAGVGLPPLSGALLGTEMQLGLL